MSQSIERSILKLIDSWGHGQPTLAQWIHILVEQAEQMERLEDDLHKAKQNADMWHEEFKLTRIRRVELVDVDPHRLLQIVEVTQVGDREFNLKVSYGRTE